MDKAIAEQWVAALRSGDYKQGTGMLRQANNEFCCLGVLCNMHAQAHPNIAAKETSPSRYMGLIGVLPMKVKKWAGMYSDSGLFRDRTAYAAKGQGFLSLMAMNDGGVSFKEIANYIEKNYENL